ncbi:MAG: SDR family oxidoreductase [Pseudomonadota bacterium]
MDLANRHCVITGAARGIGRALARALAERGAAHVAVADLDGEAARQVAEEIGGSSHQVDVSNEAQIQQLVQRQESEHGPIDLFVSNAGIGELPEDPSTIAGQSDRIWNRCWSVNVMSHVYAARALLPGMIDRGAGYLINVASAAGLLSQIGDAAYSASKHAAVAFAESLAIAHGDDGVNVSVVCPQAVATALIGYDEDGEEEPRGLFGNDLDGILSADDAAAAIVAGIEAEEFLILTHPQVRDYMRHKAENYGRWIGGMRKLRRRYV